GDRLAFFYRSRNGRRGRRDNENRFGRENLSGRLVHRTLARGRSWFARKETSPDHRRRRLYLRRNHDHGRRHRDRREFDHRRERFPDEKRSAKFARLLRRERNRDRAEAIAQSRRY